MERILTYPQAILEATKNEMSRDESVVVMGQGVDDPKAILGTTLGLLEEFGPQRVFDTPLAEDGMTGVAIGMALGGLRPIQTHIRMDFMLLAMNQIVNMAAKMSYMSGGRLNVPLVIRSMIGKSWGQGPQHSQSLYPMFMNVAGLKVVAPSTPYDAKGCLIAAIRDNNPVIFIEHRLLYYQKGPVPEEDYTVDISKARVLTEGSDITLIGVSSMAVECLRAEKFLKEVGLQAEVIDPISLNPIDIETIIKSVKKTKHVVIVDNAWVQAGFGSEIISRLWENGLSSEVKVKRIGFAATPCPTTPTLEEHFYPNAKGIASFAYAMLRPKEKAWEPSTKLEIEEIEFKGPF
ncbi:MAG: transketolase C-terminal domain-containing protein [Candidatus Omnitrophica bacterium]|nr:transketolase C-terminal domain-containing protein [Candidatus Omnitrophota bacterium]